MSKSARVVDWIVIGFLVAASMWMASLDIDRAAGPQTIRTELR